MTSSGRPSMQVGRLGRLDLRVRPEHQHSLLSSRGQMMMLLLRLCNDLVAWPSAHAGRAAPNLTAKHVVVGCCLHRSAAADQQDPGDLVNVSVLPVVGHLHAVLLARCWWPTRGEVQVILQKWGPSGYIYTLFFACDSLLIRKYGVKYLRQLTVAESEQRNLAITTCFALSKDVRP